MEARRLGLVGVIAVLVAALLAWWMSPERGPLVGVAPPTADAPSRPAAAPPGPPLRSRSAQPSSAPSYTGGGGAVPALLPRGPEPAPELPVDPNEVLSADQQGIATGMMQRRDRLIACRAAYDPSGVDRLTLKFTITDAGEGAGALDVEIPAMPTAGPLRDCLNDALSDARFVSPGEVGQSVVVFVPATLPTKPLP